MGQIVKRNLHGAAAEQFIEQFCAEKNIENTDKFVAMTLTDLGALHAGAIVGLGISESQLNKWLEGRDKI
jgi:hypothetical protein